MPFFTALEKGEITAGMVLIFRYQGPKGAPGMPEVRSTVCTISLPSSSPLVHESLTLRAADARPDGRAHGCGPRRVDRAHHGRPLLWCFSWFHYRSDQSSVLRIPVLSLFHPAGHVVPEAQVGGPIALVHDGDKIVVDAQTRTIE